MFDPQELSEYIRSLSKSDIPNRPQRDQSVEFLARERVPGMPTHGSRVDYVARDQDETRGSNISSDGDVVED